MHTLTDTAIGLALASPRIRLRAPRALSVWLLALCAPALAVAQGFTLPTFSFGSGPEDEALQKVVVVSRHGVRTPTASAAELADWAAQPWPVWNPPRAALTPRGAVLAKVMGRWYREYAGAQGMIPAAGCPNPGALFVYADVLERTKATAQALVDGFAPDCGFRVRTREGARIDPTFHPLEAGACSVDPLVAQTRVLERVGGDVNRATRDLKVQFDALQSVLDCCKPALCLAFGRAERCTLADLPSAITTLPDGAGLSLIGALPIAATTSELFLLEYLDGLPMTDVGWGRVTPAQIRDLLRLHTEQFDLMQRTPYLARRKGSALLSRVANAVTSARMLGFGVVDPAVRDAKFVLIVGHDTNIWNLAAMMDVSWSQPGWQRNQTPPAGALMFEVRERKDRKFVVYTSYVAPSMEQMRNATPLTGDAQPQRTPLRMPGCSSAAQGFPCTLEEFAVALRNVIDRECVE
ncbi:MAG: histidine-type phosphatase [Burkholderiales bacterium]|nr:histidine-type phosphatase [Burkholderiales bacterium]